MNTSRSFEFLAVVLVVSLAGCWHRRHQVSPPPLTQLSSNSVLTQHNDSMRTGANLAETQLTPKTVAAGMQLRYSRPVNGALTAQNLYAHGITINSKPRNVIFAFTDQNFVYAYDADEEGDSGNSQTGLLWSQHLPVTPSPSGLHLAEHGGVGGGILSTPVIDWSTGKLFLVYALDNGLFPSNGTGDGSPPYLVEYHLVALGLTSGAVLKDVVITGAFPSSVDPGHVDFTPNRQTQRAGLLLVPNPLKDGERTIYVAFGGRWLETTHNYHGWLMGYDSETLESRGVFCSTPDRRDNDEGGGIWQGGGGLGGDANGNVYFNTGNGPASGNDHGNSIVKLTPVLQTGKYSFKVEAFSAATDDPAHATEWKSNDIDLGGGGLTLIPNSSRLVSGGKTGVLYLMDRSTMTKVASFEAFRVDPSNDPNPEVARFLDWGHGPHLHGAWTYWAASSTRGYVYHWAEKDYLRRFDYDPATGQINPASGVSGKVLAKAYPVMPGGLISLSANGTNAGLLWVTLPTGASTGKVMALDALTLQSLWDTTTPTPVSHNGPPTVADGKVIVGTDGNLMVFGLANPPTAARKAQTSATPRAVQPLAATSHAPILPVTLDPRPWMSEYLRRVPQDKAAALTPPKGHRPLFFAMGVGLPAKATDCNKASDKGALTYEVQRADAAGSPQWVLVGVSGALCDDSGVMPHLAYRGLGQTLATAQEGLAWQIRDGGVVHWSVEASVNAPQSGDAPWVLFRSAPSGGRDLLDQITYVQLLGTVGGAPPASVGQLGDRVQVLYSGRYVFYVSDRSAPSSPTP